MKLATPDTLAAALRQARLVPEIASDDGVLNMAQDIYAALPDQPDALRADLRTLLDYGYQPGYNGRPSCPFCGNFVDDEETHTESCVLVVALAAEAAAGEGGER